MVKRHGSSVKYRARVIAVGHECDLGLLTVDQEHFWSTHDDESDCNYNEAKNDNDTHDSENINGSISNRCNYTNDPTVPSLALGDVPRVCRSNRLAHPHVAAGRSKRELCSNNQSKANLKKD